MNIRTKTGAQRLFAVLLTVAVLAPTALAEDLGYPPAPAPLAMPAGDTFVPFADDAPPPMEAPVPGAGDAAATRDAIVIDDITPGSEASPSYQLQRAPTCCGQCRPTCCPRENPCCRKRGWDITLEASATWFEDPTGIIGLTPPAGTRTFNWSESPLDTAFGGRVTIGYRWNAKNRIEGRGGYSGEGTGSSTQAGRQFGFSATPGAATVLSPPSTATLDTEASLWNGELNWWRQLKCDRNWRIEGIAGVRYLRYEEVATARNWVGLAAGSFLSNTAKSRFLGGQLGAAAIWHGSRRLELGVSIKGLVGHMQNDVRERDVAIVTGGPTTDSVRETSNFGYGFEGEVSALLRLSRRFGITAAYTILFLGDVARAGTTLDLSQAMSGSVQVSGATESNVIHTVFVGVRVDI